MTDQWDTPLAEQLVFRKDGEMKKLRTLDDARVLLSVLRPGEDERELYQAADTAVRKTAQSGQPSDCQTATEQLRVLLRALGWV